MLTACRNTVLECCRIYDNDPTPENLIQLEKAHKKLEIANINSPESQEGRYKGFLSTGMGDEIAWQAATVFEPCYCIVSHRGNLVMHSMQCNDIAVLFRYRRPDGYSVTIFPASHDFKLSKEVWTEIKEILKGLR